MTMLLDDIKNRIEEKHSGDVNQLEVIFSSEKRLLVEAPAGCGKTSTLISKVAYMIATGQIPTPKKMLALTFSVNAAYKIKKDVINNLPKLFGENNQNFNISNKIYVTNYHGFSRRILKKHGYRLSGDLLNIDTFNSVDDSMVEKLMKDVATLDIEDANFLINFNEAVKIKNTKYILANIRAYNNLLLEKLIPSMQITYNGILTLACQLLNDHNTIRDFYHKFFVAIMVDEYQDTNFLSYLLLKYLLSDDSQIILLGDPLQRIYGFIGAIPNLFSISEVNFNLKKINLVTNYRFKDNESMLLLDANLRQNALNTTSPLINKNSNIDFKLFDSQTDEVDYLIKKSSELSLSGDKVAILVKQRGNNAEKIIEIFNLKSIPFFNGLFSDEDVNYIKFNKDCLSEFLELLKHKGIITRKLLNELLKKVKENYNKTNEQLILSLISLLEIFVNKIYSDFAYLSDDEKISLIRDTFEHNGLKQYMEFVDSNIILSTVHGAKGLEWDYVIIPDMEAFSFPNYYGLCGVCDCKTDCNLVVTKKLESKFLEELSVFYVAVTRARKQVYFSASKKRIDASGLEKDTKVSCFLSLPGVLIS